MPSPTNFLRRNYYIFRRISSTTYLISDDKIRGMSPVVLTSFSLKIKNKNICNVLVKELKALLATVIFMQNIA